MITLQEGGDFVMMLDFLQAVFLLLVLLPAPEALGMFFGPALIHDLPPQPVMGLLRGDVINA